MLPRFKLPQGRVDETIKFSVPNELSHLDFIVLPLFVWLVRCEHWGVKMVTSMRRWVRPIAVLMGGQMFGVNRRVTEL